MNMDSTFLTLPPPYELLPPSSPSLLVEPPRDEPPHLKRRRSPSFLASVRNLIPRPLKRSRSSASLKVPRSADRPSFDDSSASSTPISSPSSLTGRHPDYRPHSSACQTSCREPVHGSTRKKRRPVPSMVDYLTLGQLETVWRSQDTYKGTVDAPRTTDDLDMLVPPLFVEAESMPPQPHSGRPTPRRYHSSENIGGSRWYAGTHRQDDTDRHQSLLASGGTERMDPRASQGSLGLTDCPYG